jgi:aminopeptidase N
VRAREVNCIVVLWVSAALAPAVPHASGPAQQTSASPVSASAAPTLRLPGDVRPTRQSVELTINPREEKFSGVVDIELTMKSAVQTIWLNGSSLSIREATLHTNGGGRRLRTVPGNEQVIGFASDDGTVGPGTARLHIAYDGVISRRDIEGLFAQQEGNEWYAFTQFEALGARRAFPCFDEPTFKIPWQIALRISKDDSGFSNTPQISTASAADGTKRLLFAETRPLPSYLVAVAVGPFDVVDAGRAGRKSTPVRILVPRGHSGEARWAVETTPKLLAALEDYFDLPYPYEKLDQVSIPTFFGAMENPGLVTYGQTILLQKPEAETIPARRGYVSIAAHELAHQWFGDLVTMTWWDDIWLNESFASWLGQRITHRFRPDWGIDVEKVWSRSGALKMDGLSTARAVRQPIESTHDIANAFDGITYAKGEAVLEMLESWLGEDVFRRGVRQYIRNHEWKNATADDFIAALSSAAGRALGPAISSFLDRPGAPLITVDLNCDATNPRLGVAQKRYLPLGSKGDSTASWQLPVCIRYETNGSEQRQCTLLTTTAGEMELGSTNSCPQWVLGNDRLAGYYRVRHGGELLERLLRVDAAQLTTAERVGLLTDLPALVASGDVPAARALAIASSFAGDTNRHLVNATMNIVEGVRQFVPQAQNAAYAAMIRGLYGQRASSVGWESKAGEPEDDRLLRRDVLNIVGTLGRDASLVRQAVPLANSWLDDSKAVEADMVDVVLAVAARSGEGALFDRLHDMAKREADRDRRQHLLEGLGSFRTADLVPRALAITLEPEIDARESLWLLFSISSDPDTRASAYEFVKAHIDELTARAPRGSVFDVASFLPFVGAGFCDAQRRQDVEAFFAPRVQQAAGGPRNLAQALESIDLCIAQRHVQETSVSAFLSSSRTANNH